MTIGIGSHDFRNTLQSTVSILVLSIGHNSASFDNLISFLLRTGKKSLTDTEYNNLYVIQPLLLLSGSQIPACPIAQDTQNLGRTTKICYYFTMKQQGWWSSMPEGHRNMRMNLGPWSLKKEIYIGLCRNCCYRFFNKPYWQYKL